jgi:hypothetical protein
VAAWLVTQGGRSLVVDSGNGGHLLYRIDLPNDAASRSRRAVLEVLALKFSDAT